MQRPGRPQDLLCYWVQPQPFIYNLGAQGRLWALSVKWEAGSRGLPPCEQGPRPGQGQYTAGDAASASARFLLLVPHTRLLSAPCTGWGSEQGLGVPPMPACFQPQGVLSKAPLMGLERHSTEIMLEKGSVLGLLFMVWLSGSGAGTSLLVFSHEWGREETL